MRHGTARDVRIVLVMKPIYAEDAAIVIAVRPSARNAVKNVQNVQTGFVMTAENVLNAWEIRIIVNIVIFVLSAQAAMFVYSTLQAAFLTAAKLSARILQRL
jgi:hypothetical protein